MNKHYKEVLERFPKTKILVVGDIALDHYVRGEVHRVSPEAPVPVILEKSVDYALGVAGNTAANIAALGGQVTLLGLIGSDPEGRIVRELCKKANITPRLISEAKRPTSRKTRAVSGQYQLLRLDREIVGDITKSTEKKVIGIVNGLPEYNIIVVSDYAKGFMTSPVMDALKRKFLPKRIIANVKPSAKMGLYKNLRAITLNAKEGHDLTGIKPLTNSGAADVARTLSKNFQTSVVLTRGEHGIVIYDRSYKKTSYIPSAALQVYDVAGAGDTVIATLALMQGSGATLYDAAYVANQAASVVVGKRGTVAISIGELRAKLFS